MVYFIGIVGLFMIGFVCYTAGFLRAWNLWDAVAGSKLTPDERAKVNGEA